MKKLITIFFLFAASMSFANEKVPVASCVLDLHSNSEGEIEIYENGINYIKIKKLKLSSYDTRLSFELPLGYDEKSFVNVYTTQDNKPLFWIHMYMSDVYKVPTLSKELKSVSMIHTSVSSEGAFFEFWTPVLSPKLIGRTAQFSLPKKDLSRAKIVCTHNL